MKAYYRETIRLDVEYFRDGSVHYRFMKPDRRKMQQKVNWTKRLKWQRGIGSGYSGEGDLQSWNEKSLTAIQFHGGPGRIPCLIGALAAHLAYIRRCLLHDFGRNVGEQPWLRKEK